MKVKDCCCSKGNEFLGTCSTKVHNKYKCPRRHPFEEEPAGLLSEATPVPEDV